MLGRYYAIRKFIVYSDQKSLKQLLQQRITTGSQQNWLAKLLGYNFEIVYKLGLENKGADALSRSMGEMELISLAYILVWLDYPNLITEVHESSTWRKVIEDLKQDQGKHIGFEYKQCVLFFKDKLVVAKTSSWIPKLMEEFHATPQGVHSGFYRTYRRLASNLFWKEIKGDIMRFVQDCDVCQCQKYLTTAPGGLLQPLPIPYQVWEDISLDFITGLPRSKGFEAILVVVDRLSKYSHFIPLRHPYAARAIAKIFVKEVIRLHGVPNFVVSDRDPLFMSLF